MKIHLPQQHGLTEVPAIRRCTRNVSQEMSRIRLQAQNKILSERSQISRALRLEHFLSQSCLPVAI